MVDSKSQVNRINLMLRRFFVSRLFAVPSGIRFFGFIIGISLAIIPPTYGTPGSGAAEITEVGDQDRVNDDENSVSRKSSVSVILRERADSDPVDSREDPALDAKNAYDSAVAHYSKAKDFYIGRILKMTPDTPRTKRAELYRQSVEHFRTLDAVAGDAIEKSNLALQDHEVKRSSAKDTGVIRFHTERIQRLSRDIKNLTGLMANARHKTETQTVRLNEALRAHSGARLEIGPAKN